MGAESVEAIVAEQVLGPESADGGAVAGEAVVAAEAAAAAEVLGPESAGDGAVAGEDAEEDAVAAEAVGA